MFNPFLSIVTISFNQAEFLRQCIDSVVSQKKNDVEYIVVDPGSTDGSREVLLEYEDKIDQLVLEPDSGPAEGLNNGFTRSRGDVGYFLNSDDFLLPGAVDSMRLLWRDATNYTAVMGGAWMVDKNGDPLRELVSSSTNILDLLSGDAKTVQQGVSFRMSAFREAGGFNTANNTCWDFELFCRLLTLPGEVRLTRERFGAFRIYGDSISGGAGGNLHARRYLEDLNRLHLEFTGRPFPAKTPTTAALLRARCSLRRPLSTISTIWDRVFPSNMRRRFIQDLNRKQVGSG